MQSFVGPFGSFDLRFEANVELWLSPKRRYRCMLIALDEAVSRLQGGEIVAIATETVYGLAARIDRPKAIDAIFFRKRRPQSNPLIIHLQHFEQISRYLSPAFENEKELLSLSRAFWPGPLTLVLPVGDSSIPDSIRAGLPTAAFRIPAHPLTRDLLQKTGPLVAPSANLSGRPSPTTSEHVEVDFGIDFPILDGGPCSSGLESTILGWHLKELHLMRKGAIEPKELERVLGRPLFEIGEKAVQCPGCSSMHYAPRARLIIDPNQLWRIGAIVGFEDRAYKTAGSTRLFSLGSIKDDKRAARQLFATLRSLDAMGIKEAFVDLNLPKWGLWPAICDRLTRASRR